MTGTTNQVQTPFGSGVRTALALAAGAAGGVSNLPANPNVSYTGTVYGPLFTVWNMANITPSGYGTPLVAANYDNAAANGATFALPNITTLDFGSIQIIVNSLAGSFNQTSPMTITANSLIQIGGAFTWNTSWITSLSMPLLAYVGGDFSPTMTNLTSMNFPALIAVNGAFGAAAGNVTTTFPALQYIGGNCGLNMQATTIAFTSLQYVGGAISGSAPNLTSLTFPALVTVVGIIQPTAANLVTFSFGSTLKSLGANVVLTGMKLNQASVDGILVSLAALDGTGGTTAWSSKTVNLSGGTSSAPSGTGTAAAAVLTGRGCTVTTN